MEPETVRYEVQYSLDEHKHRCHNCNSRAESNNIAEGEQLRTAAEQSE